MVERDADIRAATDLQELLRAIEAGGAIPVDVVERGLDAYKDLEADRVIAKATELSQEAFKELLDAKGDEMVEYIVSSLSPQLEAEVLGAVEAVIWESVGGNDQSAENAK